ncbi:MAG: viroplasmin family protein [[Clostridium] leptum]
MAAKFYAVRKGRTTGIFTSWSQCQQQVTGYLGASFKSFPTRGEAQRFLETGFVGGQADVPQKLNERRGRCLRRRKLSCGYRRICLRRGNFLSRGSL